MKKNELRELWGKTEKQLKEIGEKVVVIAKDIKKDAVYGAKASKIGIEKLSLETRKKKTFADIGSEIYKLYKKGKTPEQSVVKFCKMADAINRKLSAKERAGTTLKSALTESKKTAKKSPAKSKSKPKTKRKKK